MPIVTVLFKTLLLLLPLPSSSPFSYRFSGLPWAQPEVEHTAASGFMKRIPTSSICLYAPI